MLQTVSSQAIFALAATMRDLRVVHEIRWCAVHKAALRAATDFPPPASDDQCVNEAALRRAPSACRSYLVGTTSVNNL